MGIFDSMPGLNMIDSFLNPQRGYENAEKEMRRAWEQSQGFQTPYWQAGLDQRNRLLGAEDALLDPSGLLNQWIGSYEESPYAKQLLEQSKNAGLDAASSMGLMGSSAAVNNIQQGANNIVNQDRQQYLNDLMNKYMAGIGLGQNIYGTGAQMGANLGQGALNAGQMLGQARFGATNAPGELFGSLLNAAIAGGMKMPGTGVAGGFNQGVPPYMQKAIYGA